MIAVDTQILVYALRGDSPFHEAAANAVRSLAEGLTPWSIPWPCLHECFSIVTHPSIYKPPMPSQLFLRELRSILDSPSVRVLSETENHLDTLEELIQEGAIVGPGIHDARIAAICVGNGVDELWTADRDFARFPRLRIRNPLKR